jgi:hypothetical protein
MTDRDGAAGGRRRFLKAAALATSATLAGCFGNDDEPDRERLPFQIRGDGFERHRGESFEDFLVRGVNLGMAKPGRFPGEAAIDREEYDRWLAGMGELNANAVRVYTIHPPAFYEALARYNERADEPLYLFHGAWIGERRLHEFGDATRVSEEFHAELRRVVDVVHGEADLPERPGHASGSYTADVSDYLLGYIPGIEWGPTVVRQTNEAGGDGEYEGEYVETVDGSPFERWLAESLDVIAGHADREYGTQRPLSFTNWVTTDPLEHPYEPFELEDAVSVDPDAIVPTDAFDAGTFASYHAYPYYPDLLNHTPEYVEYVDHRGERNSYAGYLDDLSAATDQPLLLAEFGVPDSRGIAHRHVHGRDQGRHTEREQGEIVAAMYEDVVEAGTAGGLVFSWQDEWFKRTWNLAAFSEPNRRPFWSNVQTPEQRFGLLTFDPADRISLDGSLGEWEDAERFEPDGPVTSLADGRDAQRTLTGLAVTHDAAALSILLEFDSLAELDWTETNAVVTVGHTGRGNTTLPLGLDAGTQPTDFLIRLGGPGESRLLVDAYYDAFARRFGEAAGIDLAQYRRRDSGAFVPSRMTLNYRYTVPPTDEVVPFGSVETGRLRYGNGNPESTAYDSLADVHVSRADDVIELRLPWLLLNVADPSSRLALADLWEGEISSFEPMDGLSVGAGTYRPGPDGTAREVPGGTNLTHAVPGVERGELLAREYTWEPWNRPEYTERRKESFDVVRRQFDQYR